MGCCLFALVLAGAPRVATIFWWLVDPFRFAALFSNWVFPILGVLFIPWTTLAYVLVGRGPGVFGWFILIFAFVLDISTYGGGGSRG
ncbi:MAG: hypothetical protein ABH838_00165 [Actinomycetota bacterium]